jgi:hypothetical protein
MEFLMIGLFALATLGAAGSGGTERPTIAGVVHGDAGKPRKGATVFISTAAPRQGVGVL